MVKNPPVKAGDERDMDCEDSMEEEVTTHSSILSWSMPWTEKPGGLQHMGLQESDMTE